MQPDKLNQYANAAIKFVLVFVALKWVFFGNPKAPTVVISNQTDQAIERRILELEKGSKTTDEIIEDVKTKYPPGTNIPVDSVNAIIRRHEQRTGL